ncbi:DNA polymerase III subunit chi [Halovulum dunhuangense]|uniref:DNA polymerase III subunit chi n=1 Tax=Halovulum dunhuangense TaxID=1505036 RepID=A0A849L3H1_9RHOB|nr:DNA polymerase III subunit chi [Halovulum dunhuangense]NNU80803.1 DNA polymerase III subunit chi [Halovulum dunhuangense]
MGEVLFYHLTDTSLDQNLPRLLELSLGRGWKVVVRAGSDGRLAQIDEMLWTQGKDSFLPHGTAAMGHAALQPVFLTTGRDNPAGANILMLVAGARVDPAEAGDFDRVCLIFDGNDADALTAARADWVKVRDAGLSGTYHAQEGGTWVKKAATGGPEASGRT